MFRFIYSLKIQNKKWEKCEKNQMKKSLENQDLNFDPVSWFDPEFLVFFSDEKWQM